jgi:hypothetical protein
MKKLLAASTAALMMVALASSVAVAAPAPKTTGLVGVDAGGYTIYNAFAAIQTSTVATAWALPVPFVAVHAFPAKGFYTQSSTVWGTFTATVDTVGVAGKVACFSGIYDYGTGQMRYTACVVDGGQPGAGHDQWFSRWDIVGAGMGTFPVISGNLQVH